jgi:hypothetical protein
MTHMPRTDVGEQYPDRGGFGSKDERLEFERTTPQQMPGRVAPQRFVPQSTGSLMGRPLPPPPQVEVVDTGEEERVPPAKRRVEQGELVVANINLDNAQLAAKNAAALGFRIKRRRTLNNLGFVMTTLRTPKGVSVRQALTRLRAAMPTLWTDANTRFGLRSAAPDPKRYGPELVGMTQASPDCGAGIRIGIVDSSVDTSHPAFAGQRVTVESMLTKGIRPAPQDHATAIAAILAGNPHQPEYAGLIPGAEIYTASVFRLRGRDHVDTTVELVILALDWLAGKQVSVINFSLGGPRNLILEAALNRIFDQGIIVVGAAGNNGPDSPPDYPGAQDGVIAVTAVDADLHAFKDANRGNYISFAAPGVDLWSAKPGGQGSYVTGTSFAVPYVVAAVAMERLADPRADVATIVQRLREHARDLGTPDKDNVYGWGLVKIRRSCTSGGFQ